MNIPLVTEDIVMQSFFLCLSLSPQSCVGTFKIQKTRLQREGYDPRLTSDQIYFLNSKAPRYEAIDEELYNAIVEGRISL